MTARLGYRSCRKHGRATGGVFVDLIDINCADCIIWPKRKSDVDYLKDARVILGLDREPPAVVGDQLSFGVMA